MTTLIGSSLIRAAIEQKSFEIHQLTQLSIRKWLEIHKQSGKWRKKSREIMIKTFLSEEYESRKLIDLLSAAFTPQEDYKSYVREL